MSGLYYFALAPKDPEIKSELNASIQVTPEEYAAIYNTSDADSLGSMIAATDALLATSYNCAS